MNILQKPKTNITKYLPLLILALGAVLRFAYLGTVPAGMHQDETFVAYNAYSLYHDGVDSAGKTFPVYLSDWGDGHSALYSWLLLPLLALNGGEVTSFLTRLPQAVIGTLTLWAVYCLLKRMFGRKQGLWGMFLLAICPWHVMMSRWGLDANLAPAFLIFGLYFFIRSLEDQRFLPVCALMYGLSLYSYAVIWPIVPLMLILQIGYTLYHKKLKINRISILSSVLLFVMALPLLLFVLVNSGLLPEIRLPFMTIPEMNGYRGSELTLHFSGMWNHLRTVGSLLLHQNIGTPYDILLPYGLFYNIGRIFIIVGFFSLTVKMVLLMKKKEFSCEFFIFVQLIGAGIVGLLVTVILHQINCLYIPLVLCEAYGVWTVCSLLSRFRLWLGRVTASMLIVFYLVCLIFFQRDYYTDYRLVVNAYFGAGIEESIDYAMEQGNHIIVEKGIQWPRLLLFSETRAPEYLEHVVYSQKPAPSQFTTGNTTFSIGIDYDQMDTQSVYIIYYTDVPLFEADFELKQFYDWYVAVPG